MSTALTQANMPTAPQNFEEEHEGRERSIYTARGPIILGMTVLALFLATFGAWAAFAPLAKGVKAMGTVEIEIDRQIVQHFDGGIIEEILVQDNDFVKEGDILFRLQDEQTRAEHDAILKTFIESHVVEARLVAELEGSESISFPDEVLDRAGQPEVQELILDQTALFEARREERLGQVEILEQRIEQLKRRVDGINAQKQARVRQQELLEEELVGLRTLLASGHVQRTRVLALERALADLSGQSGRLDSDLAESQVQIGESQMQILQLTRTFETDAIDRLTRIRDQQSRADAQLTNLRARLDRVEIRAPYSGIAIGSKIHTIGGVIRPGEVLVSIVPDNDDIVIETQVKPTDIEAVRAGQVAEVRIAQGVSKRQQRMAPVLHGELASLSADTIEDPRTGEKYYKAKVIVPAEEMAKLGDGPIVPGMNAQILFKTGTRTPAQFIISPISDMFEKGLVAP